MLDYHRSPPNTLKWRRARTYSNPLPFLNRTYSLKSFCNLFNFSLFFFFFLHGSLSSNKHISNVTKVNGNMRHHAFQGWNFLSLPWRKPALVSNHFAFQNSQWSLSFESKRQPKVFLLYKPLLFLLDLWVQHGFLRVCSTNHLVDVWQTLLELDPNWALQKTHELDTKGKNKPSQYQATHKSKPQKTNDKRKKMTKERKWQKKENTKRKKKKEQEKEEEEERERKKKKQPFPQTCALEQVTQRQEFYLDTWWHHQQLHNHEPEQ